MSILRLSFRVKVSAPALLAALIALTTSGCLLKQLNAGHYAFHLDTGLLALDNENFEGAKKQFSIAYWYAQIGWLGPEAEAAALYNYGLAAGQLGDLPKAEENFRRAMALDEKTEGKKGPHSIKRLLELARLYQAWDKNDLSRETYEKAFPIVNKYDADKEDPIGFATVLDDYASVLEKLDLHAEATAARAQAAEVRRANPGKAAITKIRHYPAPSEK
jgi:tetratricopeptide (TPR) repeat protein